MPKHSDQYQTIIVARTLEESVSMRHNYSSQGRTQTYSGATVRMALHGRDLSGVRVIISSSLWHEPGMPQLLRDKNAKEVLVVF